MGIETSLKDTNNKQILRRGEETEKRDGERKAGLRQHTPCWSATKTEEKGR